MASEDGNLQAKALSFGYAATCLSAALIIATIEGHRLSLRLALMCFAAGIPTALLAGVLYHISRDSRSLTRTQAWVLKTSDWFSILMTFAGIAFLLWHKERFSGEVFALLSAVSAAAFVAFIAAKKRRARTDHLSKSSDKDAPNRPF